MPLLVASSAAGSPSGFAVLADGVFVAAALTFLLAYKQVLASSNLDRRDLTTGLHAAGASLAVAFVAIVAVRTLLALPA